MRSHPSPQIVTYDIEGPAIHGYNDLDNEQRQIDENNKADDEEERDHADATGIVYDDYDVPENDCLDQHEHGGETASPAKYAVPAREEPGTSSYDSKHHRQGKTKTGHAQAGQGPR